MAKHPNAALVHDRALAIAEQNARMREVMASAVEVLKLPKPDLFLGRKTYEPFPKEEDD